MCAGIADVRGIAEIAEEIKPKTHRKMTYKETIKKVTGCTPQDAVEIEDYMRNIYFHSTLDWQTKAQFNKGAKESYNDILWMRSPEGIEYMKQLENQNAR